MRVCVCVCVREGERSERKKKRGMQMSMPRKIPITENWHETEKEKTSKILGFSRSSVINQKVGGMTSFYLFKMQTYKKASRRT